MCGQKGDSCAVRYCAGEIFSYCYGVKAEGNAEMDPFDEFKGKNILFDAHSIDEVAENFDMSKEDIETSLTQSKIKLLAARSKRPRPHLDDKVLTSWNGLMISALSKSYQVLGEKRYLEAAENAAIFFRKNLYDDKTDNFLEGGARVKEKSPVWPMTMLF